VYYIVNYREKNLARISSGSNTEEKIVIENEANIFVN
jgi:hypothetical protein